MLATLTAQARAQDEDARARAHELYEQSETAYDEGRFDDAADLLREAFEIHQEPVLLYNLGRALDGAGDMPGAIESYEAYLESAGEIEDRGAIEQRVITLQRLLDEREALIEEREREEAAEDERTTTERPPTPESGPSAVPWLVTGVGVAGVGVGVALGLMSRSAHGDTETAGSQVEVGDALDRAEDLALGANIALIAGGAIALGGLVWGIIDLMGAGPDEAEEGVTVAFTGTGLVVGGAL